MLIEKTLFTSSPLTESNEMLIINSPNPQEINVYDPFDLFLVVVLTFVPGCL